MGVPVRPFTVSLPRKYTTLTFAIFLSTLFLFILGRSKSHLQYALPLGVESVVPERLRVPLPCQSDLDYLRSRNEYNLTRNVVYQKRCIRAKRSASTAREVVGEVSSPLLQERHVIDLRRECKGAMPEDSPCEPIDVKVPPPFPQRDYSDYLFGVASSSERLIASIPYFSHWLKDTNARLLAMVTDGEWSKKQMKKLTKQFRNAGIEFVGTRPANISIHVNEQHFLLVRNLLEHADAGTTWTSIIDDDTFFPSLYPVAEELDRHDASVPAYVGSLSENKVAVDFHGYMPYGGGGVFLSVPMLKLLEPKVDECYQNSRVREGDGMLKFCVDQTGTNFTKIDGLHQLDMGGDLSGFYESGYLPLSLHHWKTWHTAPVDKIAQISNFCGGCLLQRWRFGPDTVLTNGYSINVYRNSSLQNIDLDKVEGTWREADETETWEWSLGPLRDKVGRGDKKSYRLIDAEVVGENLRQVYVYRTPNPRREHPFVDVSAPNEPKDEVIELWWEWE